MYFDSVTLKRLKLSKVLKTRKGWKTSTLLYFRWFEFANVKLVISYEKNDNFEMVCHAFSRSFLVCLRFFACNTAIFSVHAWTWYSKYHCTTALTEFRIKIMFGISINGHPQKFFHGHKVFIVIWIRWETQFTSG